LISDLFRGWVADKRIESIPLANHRHIPNRSKRSQESQNGDQPKKLRVKYETKDTYLNTHQALGALVTNPLVPIAKVSGIITSFTRVSATPFAMGAHGVVGGRSHNINIVLIHVLVLVDVGNLPFFESLFPVEWKGICKKCKQSRKEK